MLMPYMGPGRTEALAMIAAGRVLMAMGKKKEGRRLIRRGKRILESVRLSDLLV